MTALRTIRAEIAGDDIAGAHGMTVRLPSPVLAMCRALIEAGHDPATPLEAYRGDTLCLRVRAIGEAAALQVNTSGTGFSVYRVHGPSLRPPIRQTDVPATGAASLAEAAP